MRRLVSDLLRTHNAVVYTSPDTSVTDAVQQMTNLHVGSILILDQSQRLAGIFTERDLLERVVAKDLDPKTTRIGDVMSREVVGVSASTPRTEVLQIMNSHHIRHMPVTNGDQLIGVISLRDVLRVENAEKDFEIEQLRQYILQEPGISPMARPNTA